MNERPPFRVVQNEPSDNVGTTPSQSEKKESIGPRLIALAVFAICLGVSVEHAALHISHGANIALIVGAVFAFLEAVWG